MSEMEALKAAHKKQHDEETARRRQQILANQAERERLHRERTWELDQKQALEELKKQGVNPGEDQWLGPPLQAQQVFNQRQQPQPLQAAPTTQQIAEAPQAKANEQTPERADEQAEVEEEQEEVSPAADPFVALENDPRHREIDAITEKLAKTILLWEVVGGASQGGMVVREGSSLQSLQCRTRLSTGSVIRELKEKGERIYYQLVEGKGPNLGWVSVKVKNTEMLASVARNPRLVKHTQLIIKRLAALPQALQHTLAIPGGACRDVTSKIYGRKGCLAQLALNGRKAWLKHACVPEVPDMSRAYPAFPDGDPVLALLLADTSLTPLQRIFPRLSDTDETEFIKVLDPVGGLLPDAINSAFFLELNSNTLRGAVRFGPQSTQSMSRLHPEEEGAFVPGVHGGAIACLLYDAAVYLARLTWQENASLKKFSCQFSKPCPMLETLDVVATHAGFDTHAMGEKNSKGYNSIGLLLKVSLKRENVVVAFADVHLESFAWRDPQLPMNLPARSDLVPPGVDWVPLELVRARLPAPSHRRPDGWDKEGYLKAAFDMANAMKFPKSCAAVEDITKEAELKARGIFQHVRANRPACGKGDYQNDLCFTGGLAPAAMSHIKYFETRPWEGTECHGTVKFGPQASEAWWLRNDGLADGTMSMVAHYGIPLAHIDDVAAHLPRCDGRERTSVTWKIDMEAHRLIPVGHELDFRCFCPYEQKGAVGHSVTSEISFDGEVLMTSTAIITSGDR